MTTPTLREAAQLTVVELDDIIRNESCGSVVDVRLYRTTNDLRMALALPPDTAPAPAPLVDGRWRKGNGSGEYDHAIHSSPRATDWAEFFGECFPPGSRVPDEGTMLGWFANAMMAMHDSRLAPASPPKGTPPPCPVDDCHAGMLDGRNGPAISCPVCDGTLSASAYAEIKATSAAPPSPRESAPACESCAGSGKVLGHGGPYLVVCPGCLGTGRGTVPGGER